MTEFEIEICTKIRLGDIKAFDIIFKIYYSPLCRFALDILKQNEIAKETVLDVFVNIWKTKESFDVKTTLKGYLYRSVHNQCLNYLRDIKSSRKISLISIDDGKNRLGILNIEVPPEIIEKLFTEQLENDLRIAMESLPEQCRVIFYMSRFEDLSYPEIASKLNLALSTVKTQMLRAISKLKIELEKHL